VKNVIDEITDFLFGLKMTILSGIFLLIAVIFMILGINTPVYLNPAWGTVIISGIPMLLLAMTRLIREKWISSALLIAIAMVASLFIGEIFAAGEVAWIMALGALLEDWTVERAKKGLRNLINLTPQTGRKIVDRVEKIVPVDEIKLGDTLRILPGESVPVDGEIINGTTSLDQSIMTGESLPIDKEVGDEVFCGTMNMYGAIDIKATSLGENSSLQKLIDQRPGFRLGVFQYPFDHIRRHLLQQIRRIIGHQIVDNIRRLSIGQCRDDRLLVFRLHIGKHIRCQILRQNPKYPEQLILVQFLQKRRHIGFIQFRKGLSQFGILFCVQ